MVVDRLEPPIHTTGLGVLRVGREVAMLKRSKASVPLKCIIA
jgi:hypothetical protein